MLLKRVSAKVIGTHKSKIFTIDIADGTTPKDIKKQINIPKSYRTFRRKTKEFLSDTDDLDTLLETGELIEFSPEAKFGARSRTRQHPLSAAPFPFPSP